MVDHHVSCHPEAETKGAEVVWKGPPSVCKLSNVMQLRYDASEMPSVKKDVMVTTGLNTADVTGHTMVPLGQHVRGEFYASRIMPLCPSLCIICFARMIVS